MSDNTLPPVPAQAAEQVETVSPQTVEKSAGLVATPTTTEEENLRTAGQRQISLIWETTQSRIALMVVGVGVLTNGGLIIALVVSTREITVNQLAVISLCLQFINLTAGIVIGFYFSRTNHEKVGGIGQSPYQGR